MKTEIGSRREPTVGVLDGFFGSPIIVIGPDDFSADPVSGRIYVGENVWRKLKRFNKDSTNASYT